MLSSVVQLTQGTGSVGAAVVVVGVAVVVVGAAVVVVGAAETLKLKIFNHKGEGKRKKRKKEYQDIEHKTISDTVNSIVKISSIAYYLYQIHGHHFTFTSKAVYFLCENTLD